MEHRDSGPTPEKQLLKLIEQPGAVDQQKETLKRRGIALLSPSVIRGKLSFFKEKTRKYLAAKKKASLGVKGMNRILAFCTLVIAVYLAMDIISAIRELGQAIALEPTPWKEEDTDDISSEGKLHYAEKIGDRNIFSFKSYDESVNNGVGILPTPKTPEQVMMGLMNGVKYEGMSVWPGEAPKAYMKDKEGRAYTLKVGEKIGQLTVDEILDDQVWLRYGEVRLPLKKGR